MDRFRRTWPLISEDALACQAYCNRGHPFLKSSCLTFGSGTVSTCFNDLRLFRTEIEYPTFVQRKTLPLTMMGYKIKVSTRHLWPSSKSCFHVTLAVKLGFHLYGIVSPGELPYFTAFYEKEGVLVTYSNRISGINKTEIQ